MVRCSDVEADKSVVDYVSEHCCIFCAMRWTMESNPPEERLAAGKDRRGKITFSADNVAGELRMTISDDGKGIDEAGQGTGQAKGLLASADGRIPPENQGVYPISRLFHQ